MRQGTLRFATATGLVLALGMAACGGDDGESADDATTTTEAEDETTTTTEAEDDTTTTTAEATTTTAAEIDEVLTAWRATAVEFREDANGAEHEFECPPDGVVGSVWGTDIYTDDSSVCNAAVHAGLITYEDGGTVTIVIEGPQDSYTGSEQNGVTTSDYPAWPGSFSFA